MQKAKIEEHFGPAAPTNEPALLSHACRFSPLVARPAGPFALAALDMAGGKLSYGSGAHPLMIAVRLGRWRLQLNTVG
jgi:hypothetical protein